MNKGGRRQEGGTKLRERPHYYCSAQMMLKHFPIVFCTNYAKTHKAVKNTCGGGGDHHCGLSVHQFLLPHSPCCSAVASLRLVATVDKECIVAAGKSASLVRTVLGGAPLLEQMLEQMAYVAQIW